MSKENKNELIHIRIEPTVKEKSENIENYGNNVSFENFEDLNDEIYYKYYQNFYD